MFRTPEENNSTNIMEDYTMIGDTKSSWEITYKRLLEDNIRVHGLTSNKKHDKRKTKQKMNKRTYHFQDIEDVQIIGLKKKVVGLENSKHIGISFM